MIMGSSEQPETRIRPLPAQSEIQFSTAAVRQGYCHGPVYTFNQ